MAVAERSSETSPLLYQSKIDAWIENIGVYQKKKEGTDEPRGSEWEEKEEIDGLLAQGGQLFFDILEPLKEHDWIKADNSDFHHKVYFDSGDPRLRGIDRNMFGDFAWGRSVTVHGYDEGDLGRDRKAATITLGCSEQGRHGEKVIQMIYEGPIDGTTLGPQLIMRIEDRTESWVDPGKSGVVETVEEKNLCDFSSFDICKLAVSLAQIVAEEYSKKYQTA